MTTPTAHPDPAGSTRAIAAAMRRLEQAGQDAGWDSELGQGRVLVVERDAAGEIRLAEHDALSTVVALVMEDHGVGATAAMELIARARAAGLDASGKLRVGDDPAWRVVGLGCAGEGWMMAPKTVGDVFAVLTRQVYRHPDRREMRYVQVVTHDGRGLFLRRIRDGRGSPAELTVTKVDDGADAVARELGGDVGYSGLVALLAALTGGPAAGDDDSGGSA